MYNRRDYPSFYTRLYGFLDRDVLHLKHRARFFRLTELFLSSTYVALPFPLLSPRPHSCASLSPHPQLMLTRMCDDRIAQTPAGELGRVVRQTAIKTVPERAPGCSGDAHPVHLQHASPAPRPDGDDTPYRGRGRRRMRCVSDSYTHSQT